MIRRYRHYYGKRRCRSKDKRVPTVPLDARVALCLMHGRTPHPKAPMCAEFHAGFPDAATHPRGDADRSCRKVAVRDSASASLDDSSNDQDGDN